MSQTIQQALSNATFYTDDFTYHFIQLPTNAAMVVAGIIAELAEPFIAFLIDKDEITLMMPQPDYEAYQHRLIDVTISPTNYRLITFDIVLESSLVGFIAHIATALAQANISLMPFAAYSRDHIFVSESDYPKAIEVLNQLKAEAQS